MLKNNKTINNIVILLLAVLAAVSLVQGVKNAAGFSQDFQWDAAKALALRINPYDVSLEHDGILEGYDFDEYYFQMEANQFPSLLMILLPFTLLKPLAARYAWIICNLIFTALVLYLLRKTFLKDTDKQVYIILALLMIAGTPYRNHLGVGQHTLFSFCAFLVAVYFSEYKSNTTRNTVITCIALFICYFKYTLTAPLALYFVYKRRFKELIISIAAHGVLTIVAAWWLHDSFLNMIIKPLKVSSALLAEGGLDISVLLHGSSLSYVLALIIMAGLLVLSLKMPAGYDNTLMSVLTLWSLIITYHRTYDFFVIIVAAGIFTELNQSEPTLGSLSESSISNKFIYNIINITGLKIVYAIVIFMVFFFLRVFSENTFSKIMTGSIYYAFTLLITYIAVATTIYTKSTQKTTKPR